MDIEIVQILLDAGADVDELSNEGRQTAPQAAAGNGYEEIVRTLLNAGAHVDLIAAADAF